MSVIIPPGFAQVSVSMVEGSTARECTNVFGVALTGPPTQAEVDTLCGDLAAAYKPWLSTGSLFSGIRVLVGQDGGDPTVLESTDGTGAGARGGDFTSPQVQALIKKTGPLAARNNIGRTFLCDVTEANLDSAGNISGAQLTLLVNTADAIQTSFGLTDPWNGIVLLHSTADEPTVVVRYAAQTKCATLRPRFPRS